MFTWIARRFIEKFGREWSYDVSYVLDILDTGGLPALNALNAMQKVGSYKEDVPIDVLFTAQAVACRSGDCGPCLQLGTRMAQKAGVPDETIRAVLAGDRDAMTEPVRLAYDFTRAVIARDGWDGPARAQLLERYGKRAMISLALAIATARFYPDFKYALGVAHACSRVQVGSLEVVPAPV